MRACTWQFWWAVLIACMLLTDLVTAYSRKKGRPRGARRAAARKHSRLPTLQMPFMTVYEDPISSVKIGADDLFKIVNPRNRQNIDHLRGTVRERRLYCPIGKGYHLEIRRNGAVRARHKETPDSVMKISSVDISVVSIQSVAHKLFLCMNRDGKLFTRRSYHVECAFRVNLEENRYSSYASNMYSNHRRRKGFFLALTKKGRPKRGRKTSWKKKNAQWLPRRLDNR